MLSASCHRMQAQISIVAAIAVAMTSLRPLRSLTPMPRSGAPLTRPVDSAAESVRGDDASADAVSKTILIAVAVVAVSFFVSLKAMDWVAPRGTVRAPVLVELPPLPPAPRSFQHHRAGRDRAVGDSRRRRSRRAAQLRRQGRQSGVADPAERRYRLDRLARADRRDRRPGRAVAVDAADGHAERDGLAVGEGDRRGRRRARRPARRQCRQDRSAA